MNFSSTARNQTDARCVVCHSGQLGPDGQTWAKWHIEKNPRHVVAVTTFAMELIYNEDVVPDDDAGV